MLASVDAAHGRAVRGRGADHRAVRGHAAGVGGVARPRELDGLLDVAEEAEARLAAVGRVSFVHSDLNPKNLIVDPDSLRVAAVLDWEFAHAGSPYTDLGNAVRFDRQPAWVEAVVAAYADDPGPPSTSRAAPTCGRWWSWPPAAAGTRSPTRPTTCFAPSPRRGTCTRSPRRPPRPGNGTRPGVWNLTGPSSYPRPDSNRRYRLERAAC